MLWNFGRIVGKIDCELKVSKTILMNQIGLIVKINWIASTVLLNYRSTFNRIKTKSQNQRIMEMFMWEDDSEI